MAYTLQQTINFAGSFIQYSPQTAGLGQEPAVSIASAIRSTILSAPFTWPWNRNENVTVTTTATTQDYALNVTDMGFIEKITVTTPKGEVYEVKDVYNIDPLGLAVDPGRPQCVAVQTAVPYTSISLRVLPVPDDIYTINITYQKAVGLLGPYFISAAANAAAGNTTYTGVFDPISFPVGSTASITGFVTNAVNNGNFVVVSCSATSLVVANASGVAETITAYVSNFNWAPIPDSFMYIYNALYLAEILAVVDDARAQGYRQRGVAALLSKATNLSLTQKNAFMQQYLARNAQEASVPLRLQQGNNARGI